MIGSNVIFRYLGLICVLAVVYSLYLHGFITRIRGTGEIELSDLMRPLVKFCLISALPFAALAYFDKAWSSADAAPVCLIVWTAVFAGFSLKYGSQCPMTAVFAFFPLVLAALLAHALGILCQKLVPLKST